ncbi:hypothetical protein Dimus_030001, partial [Dionaea muscipula]
GILFGKLYVREQQEGRADGELHLIFSIAPSPLHRRPPSHLLRPLLRFSIAPSSVLNRLTPSTKGSTETATTSRGYYTSEDRPGGGCCSVTRLRMRLSLPTIQYPYKIKLNTGKPKTCS